MKTPLGLVYAIVITVAIMAVVLFARSQSSPMIAPASHHAPPPESAGDEPRAGPGDKPPAEPAAEQGNKDEKQPPAREKAAE